MGSVRIPAPLQPHTMTRVRPVVSTDAHNNPAADYGAAAARTSFAGWLQQDNRAETFPDGRGPDEQQWTLVSNLDDLASGDRIEWSGHPSGAALVFTVHGPPAPFYRAGSATAHHIEATLRLVEG